MPGGTLPAQPPLARLPPARPSKELKVAALSSVSSLNNAIVVAERQVQRDQSQVQDDASRLDQSQAQLARDQRQLTSAQQDSAQAAPAASAPVVRTAPSAAPAFTRAIELPTALPASSPIAAKPQINTQGQAIGTLINVTA